ncbi:hypothetical protein [Flavobacterium chungbukense]|nr:hypothetical protein [Flavobacterium chungbukense]MCC4923779.1 hypothetical protein [Flavobacterium chungbukense]
MKNHNYITIGLALLGIIESYYIYNQPIARKGLELLFLIPLFFTVCVSIYGSAILRYHKQGIGLKIYYSIVAVRYIIQPFLITLSEGKLNFRMPEAKADSYDVAVLIYGIELFIACIAIKKWFPVYIKKYRKKDISHRQLPLNSYGKRVLIVYFLFLLVRFNSWMPGLNILALKESVSKAAVVFDATIFNSIKIFIFILLLAEAKKYARNKAGFQLYFGLGVIAAIFNFISYFGSNRSLIYETAIATIAILIVSYPQLKTKILAILLPFAIVIMVLSYANKQFAEDNAGTLESGDSSVVVSNFIEEYANGLWTVARSYQASIGISATKSNEALIKDFSDGLSGLSDLPGFNTISNSLKELRSSSDVFKDSLKQRDDRGQMLSLSGGFLIIGGNLLGWPVLILGNYIMIMLLVRMEAASKIVQDLYYRYMYIWMSILMGLVHCYCLQTIIFCWSKYILFYWLVLRVNRMGLLKPNKYSRAEACAENLNYSWKAGPIV